MADSGKNYIERFECHTNPSTLGSRWKRWLTSFELYADGKGLIIQPDKVDNKQRRRALLLHFAGPDVQDIFATLPDTGEATDYGKAVKALNDYFIPKVNTAYARHTFRQLVQKPNEPIQQFATRLRHAAKDCGYGTDRDNHIRDEVLAKCTSTYLRRKLLEERDSLTLARTLELADQCEKVEAQMAGLSKSETVNNISEKGKHHQDRGRDKKAKQKTKSHGDTCYRCGNTGHYGRDSCCPAKGKVCKKCGLKDHFMKMCKTKSSETKHKDSQVNNIQDKKREYAFTVSSNESPTIGVNIGGVEMEMLVDSGATSNIISEDTWEELKAQKIQCKSSVVPPNGRNLFAYASDKPLSVKGTFTCEIKAGQG